MVVVVVIGKTDVAPRRRSGGLFLLLLSFLFLFGPLDEALALKVIAVLAVAAFLSTGWARGEAIIVVLATAVGT